MSFILQDLALKVIGKLPLASQTVCSPPYQKLSPKVLEIKNKFLARVKYSFVDINSMR